MGSLSSTLCAASIADYGAPVEGWPNSMWITDRPSDFSRWARPLTEMAWNGSMRRDMPDALAQPSGQIKEPSDLAAR